MEFGVENVEEPAKFPRMMGIETEMRYLSKKSVLCDWRRCRHFAGRIVLCCFFFSTLFSGLFEWSQ